MTNHDTIAICCFCYAPVNLHYNAQGGIAWTEGHNAEPVMNARCCDSCNATVVIPARLKERQAASEVQPTNH